MQKMLIFAQRTRIQRGMRATLIPVNPLDRYLLQQRWHSANHELEALTVDSLSYRGQYMISAGDTLAVEDEQDKRAGKTDVEQIRLVQPFQLTLEEIQQLGYESLDEFHAAESWSENQWAWLMSFKPLRRGVFSVLQAVASVGRTA